MESLKALIFRTSIFILGFVAMATQIILIREAMALFSGNELIIGIFLGIWMGLTAVGSYLAVQSSKFKVQNFSSSPLLLVTLSLLPLVSLFLLVILRYTFVPYGIMPGLGQTVLVIFLALLPFCLVSGMLFPMLVQSLSALRGKNLLYEGYALDSAGSIIGGLLFSLIFILVIPPFESLVLLSAFGLLCISILSVILKRFTRAITILFLAILVFLLPAIPELAKVIDQKQFSNQDVIEIKSSPYAMITVTRISDQVFIYQNGIPVSKGDDVVTREESVHYAMLLHPFPEKALMISGAANGSIEEVMKYTQSILDYVDRDPWLLRVIDQYLPLPHNQRVSYFFEDARIYLKRVDKKYDVILVNISEPTSAEMNRFYTVEFYQSLKDRLSPGGLVSVSTRAAGNYMDETSRQVHSVIFNTLKSVFSQVRIIPGAKDYFLASDSTMEQSIFKNYQNKGFKNAYVNPYYINEELVRMRSEMIVKDLQVDAPVNTDLKPYVFSLVLRHWLERFKINTWLIPLILLLLLILSLIMLGPLNLGLFAGGFTSSALEFLLLIWFQVVFGFVYQMTGVIFALFMAGIVFGALIQRKIFKTVAFSDFLKIQAFMAIFSALVAITILLFSFSLLPLFSSSLLLYVIVFLLVFTSGSLMGLQFALSARLRKTRVIASAGESFSADLLGSAIGVLLVSVYLVPQFGMPMTGFMLAGMNVVVLIYNARRSPVIQG